MNRKCKILKLARNIIIAITLLVQGTLIGVVTLISSLTNKKAGVMHHVYYRRDQYEQGIYSPANLDYQFVLFLAIGILFAVLLAVSVNRNKGRVLCFELAMASLVPIAAALVIKSSFFEALLAYPYFVMALEISTAVQMASLAAVLFLDKKAGSACR